MSHLLRKQGVILSINCSGADHRIYICIIIARLLANLNQVQRVEAFEDRGKNVRAQPDAWRLVQPGNLSW